MEKARDQCASADELSVQREHDKCQVHRSIPNQIGERGVMVALTLRQTCPRPKPQAQYAFKDSMIHVQRRSHYVSHFAAFFIVARAKISIVESCLGLNRSTIVNNRIDFA